MLSYEEIRPLQTLFKQLGIKQFFYVLKNVRNWQKQTKSSIIKWGEEIEGHFLQLSEDKQLELCLGGLESLPEEYKALDFPLQVESGRWMFEFTPAEPYQRRRQPHLVQNLNEKPAAAPRK